MAKIWAVSYGRVPAPGITPGDGPPANEVSVVGYGCTFAEAAGEAAQRFRQLRAFVPGMAYASMEFESPLGEMYDCA